MTHALITGVAGFIGSQLSEMLLARGGRVTGIDNFVRGVRPNLAGSLAHPSFQLIEQDLSDLPGYQRVFEQATEPIDIVWHLAANSDISAGVADPAVDLRDTYLTTFNTLLVMRERGIRRIAFASTSAIYGVHDEPLMETTGPLFPISNYGAMKLAGEASISAAVEGYLERAWIFRFPNVIGPRSTHGIIYDLLMKLKTDPPYLEVLGDGRQQKPYLHVSELLNAMLFIVENSADRLNYFNIGPSDEGATVRSIAETVLRVTATDKKIRYTGRNSGWVGDVPRFRYSIEKLADLGWRPRYTSEQAVGRAVREIYEEFQGSCSLSS